jgi:hypothetical protein
MFGKATSKGNEIKRGRVIFLLLKGSAMPSNNDNDNEQKLGGSGSDLGFCSGEGRKSDQDKENVHELDSYEVWEPGNKGGQSSYGGTGYQEGGGQGNQRQTTNAESGSTRGSSFEQHVKADRKGRQSHHDSKSEQLPSGRRESQNQRTNRETGTTRGGAFKHNAKG